MKNRNLPTWEGARTVLRTQSLLITLRVMFGCLRLLRVLSAWLAIVAYMAPVVAHGAASTHARAAAPSCHDMVDDHAAPMPGPVALEMSAADTDTEHPRGAKAGPSAMCCVAMCAPALPSPVVIGAWSPGIHAASESRVVEGVVVAFVTRLDRPPKPRAAPIG